MNYEERFAEEQQQQQQQEVVSDNSAFRLWIGEFILGKSENALDHDSVHKLILEEDFSRF